MGGSTPIEVAADGWAVYGLPAAIRQHNADEVRRGLIALIDSGYDRLRLDMTELEQVDSAGLALMMSFLATLHRERPAVEVQFDGLSPHLMRVVNMIRPRDFGVQIEIRGAAQ